MSATIVDMAKVTQAMDAGWHFELYRGGLGTYVVKAIGNESQMRRLEQFENGHGPEGPVFAGLFIDEDGECFTDDFTPEQALTRMAYKVHGEII